MPDATMPLSPAERRVLARLTLEWQDVADLADALGLVKPTGTGRVLWSLRKLGLAETLVGPRATGRLWRRTRG